MPSKPIEHVNQMGGEADAYRHVANCILKDQVPTKYPCKQLAQDGVRVRIGAARDGNHRGQLRVAKGRKTADNGYQHKRQGESRSRPRTAEGRSTVNEIVKQGCVQDGGRVKFLPGDCGSNYRKDSRSDHSAYSQCGQGERPQSFLEPPVRLFGVGDQLVDGLTGEKLAAILQTGRLLGGVGGCWRLCQKASCVWARIF